MKSKDWKVMISMIALVVLFSPTIRVFFASEASKRVLGKYEIFDQWNQLFIWIAVCAAFTLYALVGARLIMSFHPVTVFVTNWIVGGLFLTLVRDEMLYFAQGSWGIKFPQTDIWTSMIWSLEDLSHIAMLGLAVAVITLRFGERILDTDLSLSRPPKRHDFDFEELFRQLTETPPTKIT